MLACSALFQKISCGVSNMIYTIRYHLLTGFLTFFFQALVAKLHRLTATNGYF
ncbi:hypothetical protein HanXRQr2_Chr01g0026531 [Helianthus annuus]|uniref:Uncharacterized protein n=1 Tax=Helianthus annuus TaxID=4232 RepID=A0A9K3P4W0_HELAN|nr:hypothetical protein HanXRQr2_Chr01g0026531 [Helianthus annuus]KAJ0957303.1 hypothetical protein HanPSC8_Chr01g0025631 [Helianthus annuus]